MNLADTWDAWLTALVVLGMIAALIHGRLAADMAFLGVILILTLATEVAAAFGLTNGPLSTRDAVDAMASREVLTVGMLYIVAEGMRQTGAMGLVVKWLMGQPKSARTALARMCTPVVGMSAFLNNTPIVAMFLPVLDGVARRSSIPASKLFMPLSFAAILGGVCTLIGTSTNLVVARQLNDAALTDPTTGQPIQMGLFTISLIGVPIALFGIAYIMLLGDKLLPNRKGPLSDSGNVSGREYLTAVRPAQGSGIIGKTVDQAGLRHLPGLYLSRIDRPEGPLLAVSPTERIRPTDILVFVGQLDSVKDLQQVRGLVPVNDLTDSATDLPDPPVDTAQTPAPAPIAPPNTTSPAAARAALRLIEVVVSGVGNLAGRTIRESAIRTTYGAVVVGVHRSGHKLDGKLGDIRLRAGDVLLIEAPPGFSARYRDNSDFYMVYEHDEPAAPRHERAWLAGLIMLALIVAMGTELLSTLTASMLAAALMILGRCVTGPQARRSVQWPVLIVIASAFAIAESLDATGLAQSIANLVTTTAGSAGPWALLAGVYLMTMVLTMVMSNNAAAALMFPIVLELTRAADLKIMPFAIVIAIAASCEFSTPIGYQTNLMVQGPGGYRWLDYTRFGLPLTLAIAVLTILLVPTIYGGLTLPPTP